MHRFRPDETTQTSLSPSRPEGDWRAPIVREADYTFGLEQLRPPAGDQPVITEEARQKLRVFPVRTSWTEWSD
jgi:hypothetical protein